jgi:hypothetical protein
MFRGVVRDDSTRRPLPGAVVSLLDGSGKELGKSARADSLGQYMLSAATAGTYRVRATRIGHTPLTSNSMALLGAQVITLNLAMSAVAVRLGTVVVAERRRLNRDELMSTVGYELRRSHGVGLFLDPAFLAAYKGHAISDVLPDMAIIPQILPGLRMISGLAHTAGRVFSECKPQYFVDGWEFKYSERLSAIDANDIYGVEIYSRVTLPPPSLGAEIGDFGGWSKCGAIVVWTKAYHASLQKKRKG